MWQFGYAEWRPRKEDDSYDIELIPGIMIHSCPVCTSVQLTWLFWSVFVRHAKSGMEEDYIENDETIDNNQSGIE